MSTQQRTEVPVDLWTMRATARRLLGPDDDPDVLPPAVRDTETLTATLRGHIALLIPEVEQVARKLGRNSVPRYCALACVGEARGKLRATPGPGVSGAVAYARKLARVLDALCDHYENVNVIAPSGETPGQVAYRRLLEHFSSCKDCRTVNDAGENAGLPCETGARIYQEYRKIRRGSNGSEKELL